MYTYNLLFNFAETNGRFDGDRGGTLNKSKNWLRLKLAMEPEPANPDPSVFNPERPLIWKDLGEAGTLLLRRTAPVGTICIRVAASPVDPSTTPPTPALPASATLQLVVTFGRPVRANQPQASPFRDSTDVRTTFVFGPMTRNSTTAGGAVPDAWFFPLGKIAPASASVDPDLTERYEFSLGIIVKSGGVTRHFGEDPEMDVGD